MRLITEFELKGKKKGELQAIFRKVSADTICTKPHSTERQNAQASLKNIMRALNCLTLKP